MSSLGFLQKIERLIRWMVERCKIINLMTHFISLFSYLIPYASKKKKKRYLTKTNNIYVGYLLKKLENQTLQREDSI